MEAIHIVFLSGRHLQLASVFLVRTILHLQRYEIHLGLLLLSCLCLQVLRSFQGGPESFLSHTGVSQIHGFESVHDYLQFENEPPALLSGLRTALLTPGITYRQLVERFLRGQGLPCPDLFNQLRGLFHASVDLSALDTPAFRTKMFVWAATGSPLISVTLSSIMVSNFIASSFDF